MNNTCGKAMHRRMMEGGFIACGVVVVNDVQLSFLFSFLRIREPLYILSATKNNLLS
jgi:hypothetical protein